MGKHDGRTKTRIYRIWRAMQQRCNSQNNNNYPRYGGRGIEICSEWNDFYTFRDWSFVSGYKDNLSLDRIDNNGNYNPHNCKWSTCKEQSRNRKSNLTYKGETAVAASERLGGNKTLVSCRCQLGWSKEDAFNKPLTRKYEKRK